MYSLMVCLIENYQISRQEMLGCRNFPFSLNRASFKDPGRAFLPSSSRSSSLTILPRSCPFLGDQADLGPGREAGFGKGQQSFTPVVHRLQAACAGGLSVYSDISGLFYFFFSAGLGTEPRASGRCARQALCHPRPQLRALRPSHTLHSPVITPGTSCCLPGDGKAPVVQLEGKHKTWRCAAHSLKHVPELRCLFHGFEHQLTYLKSHSKPCIDRKKRQKGNAAKC